MENIANFIKEDVSIALQKLSLPHQACSFILIHLAADEDHGEMTERLSESPVLNKNQILEEAKLASRFWLNIHREALA